MDAYIVHEESYNGMTIRIFQDNYPGSFKDYADHLAKFICFHRRYDLSTDDRFSTPDEVRAYAKETGAKLYPLFLYDHSILRLSTKSWVGRAQHAEWDSGQVGWAMLEKADVDSEYGKFNGRKWKKAERIMEHEVKVYDAFLRGAVFGYEILDADGEAHDSCWGYVGDEHDDLSWSYMIEDAKSAIDHRLQQS